MDFRAIEEKWRRRWEEARVFEADPDPNRPKFFVTVAFPYPNSPHPMAFHYTGTPILAMARRLAAGDEELIDAFTRIYKVPGELLPELRDPLKIARYFHEEIKQGMREMGYSIDWRREFTTIDPEFNRFIEWQFRKLRDRGFITRGSHPVGWCPNCQNPVGQHDTKGDVEPEIGKFTLIKFRLGDVALPAATLRPETVFGVTNLWLKPSSRYVRARVDGELWLVSRECAEKLRFLGRRVEVEGEVDSSSLIGSKALNPATGEAVPILPGEFVDLDSATGVVMSVPAHAPYDLVALRQVKGDPSRWGLDPSIVEGLEPIPIIEAPGYGEVPAATVVDRLGISDQGDPRLEEATRELYRVEFHSGTMRGNTGPYAGMPVSEARERVREDLARRGDADEMYELMNGPIYCRCGAKCVVKIFEDQWFINYGDPEWKRLAHECLNSMNIVPDELRQEFSNVLDWLKEKACARRSGLGTRLPWDRGWIIESLSDSTIYMAYYTVANVLKGRGVKAEQLTDEVFDYVFLGQGSPGEVSARSGIPVEVLEEMRGQFTYFYPLDSRHSGRDLVWNHLAFMIFNHVAIFPRELWPRQIVVNGSVLMEGKKMSKSMGNIIPLREAIKEYGADPLRLALLISAELLADADFSPSLARSMQDRLRRLYSFAKWVVELGEPDGSSPLSVVDRWMLSRLQRHVKAATEAMDRVRVREACHIALYELDRDVQWYLRRVEGEVDRRRGAIARVLREVLSAQVRMLAPMTPHICEELWEMLGGEGFVSRAPWPSYDESKVDVEAELSEGLVMSVVEDVENIVKVLRSRPSKAHLYVASRWKWGLLKAVVEAYAKTADPRGVMREVMSREEVRGRGGEAAQLARRLIEVVASWPPEERGARAEAPIDELKVLSEAKGFLERALGMEVRVYSEDDESRYDPKGRARQALPYRPAIYLE
ncbi:leucine--tRNA ligase [Candidatus Geothermarchaeota archaeon ex4572_27]|nr:MAG: leucine--tRNA ligase [Candidatus Geothermarchaeota archaeon ex4572_27]